MGESPITKTPLHWGVKVALLVVFVALYFGYIQLKRHLGFTFPYFFVVLVVIALIFILRGWLDRARWGFKFSLILLVELIAVMSILFAYRWLTLGGYGYYGPTQTFATQVMNKIAIHIAEGTNFPSDLSRQQGKGKGIPRSTSANLLWFSYDVSQNRFQINCFDSISATGSKDWAALLLPELKPILEAKKQGHLARRFSNSLGDYLLNGQITSQEPRVLGLLTDLNILRSVEIQKALNFAGANYPGMEFASSEMDSFMVGPSELFILARDGDGKIIAKLGTPGEYTDPKEDSELTVRQSISLKNLGFSLEVCIPRCFEKVWWQYLKLGFVLLLAVWTLTAALWIRAERRGK
ncbi:MAG: hypothetical protein NTW14_10395 [bacterium]|nr:hypothetical protein [bacterium]